MKTIQIEFPPLSKILNKAFHWLLKDNSQIILLYGGRGSSKSHSVAVRLILKCLSQPYFKGVLLRQTFESIKDSQWTDIKSIIESWGLGHLFSFNVSPLEIRCINGNGFICRGLDKKDKLKSLSNPTDIWFEEMNQISYDSFINSVTSLRTKKAKHLQVYGTFNPEADGDYEKFWIYKNFFVSDSIYDVNGKSFKGIQTIDIDGKQIELKYTVHHSTYHDNQHITDASKAMYENLKYQDLYYYQVFTLGEWGQRQIQNRWMTHYDREKHEGIALLRANERIIMSIDFNIDPFCANFAHIWTDNKGEHVHIFDEISLKGGSIEGMADEIRTRYGNLLYLFEVTGDNNGNNRSMTRGNKSLYQQLASELGLTPRQFKLPPNPQHKVSRAHCNKVLYSHPDFKINPVKCPNTVRDMFTVEAKEDGDIKTKDSIKKQNRADDTQQADHLDNVRYLINTYLQHWRK